MAKIKGVEIDDSVIGREIRITSVLGNHLEIGVHKVTHNWGGYARIECLGGHGVGWQLNGDLCNDGCHWEWVEKEPSPLIGRKVNIFDADSHPVVKEGEYAVVDVAHSGLPIIHVSWSINGRWTLSDNDPNYEWEWLDALNWDASAPYSERTVVAKVTSEGIEVVSDVASREPPVTSRILQWATDRNFWKGSTPKDQVLKLVQEFGEYCTSLDEGRCVKDDIGDMFVVLTILCEQLGTTVEGALAEYLLNAGGSGYGYEQDTLMLGSQVGDLSDVICKGKDAKSAIGDLITSLLHLAIENGYSLYDAAEHSYKEIKDRKGEMRDGVFIKEEDL